MVDFSARRCWPESESRNFKTAVLNNFMCEGVCMNFVSYLFSQISVTFGCQDGTFNKDFLQESCQACPEGFYCVGDKSKNPVSCPTGFYCTAGTGYDWKPCPKGTYSNAIGLKNESGKYFCGARPTFLYFVYIM